MQLSASGNRHGRIPLSSELSVFDVDLPVGIVLCDCDLVIVNHNRTWLGYLDMPGETLIGATLFDLLPDNEPQWQPLLARVLAGETAAAEALRVYIHGNTAIWDVNLTPVRPAADAAVAGILLVVTNITERMLSRQLLERRVQDRTRKLSALYDILAVSTEEPDMDTVLRACLHKVMAATFASGGALQLLDPHENQLALRAHAGLDAQILAAVEAATAGLEIANLLPAGDGAAGLPNIFGPGGRTGLLRDGDVSTYATVPMSAKGKTIGLLSIFRERRRAFSREDVALLRSIADQIAIVVENLNLRQDNQRLLLVHERNRLARELHDAVTQSLYSLLLFAGASRRQAQLGNLEQVALYAERVESTAKQALREMRLLLHNLRPASLEQVGLVRALRQRLDAVEGRAGVQAELITATPIDLPHAIEEALYYIASEALNNALKHAQAGRVCVRLQQLGDRITLTIEDDGNGFDNGQLVDSGGLGLTSMRERSERLNGSLLISSVPGSGTHVAVAIPLRPTAERSEASA